MTHEGRQKLLKELESLRNVRRKEVAEQLHLARQLSDGWDSPEYLEAKNAQAFVEGRIRTIEKTLSEASIIEELAGSAKPEAVRVGSRVRVRNEDSEEEVFTIVGSAEADARAGRISNQSPVGSALLGKKIGDSVEVEVPAGVRQFAVLEID
ncbi:MAG: transcription elongation factor GreA [Chloroflexi bacterium]|nr:transcription elongation factor GreA [Chloroflexota bacterium]